MPLPRKKDDGTGGAPVLDIMSAHVRLIDVEEHTEPYTVTRKSDGSQFELDPSFKCTMEIVGDGEDGAEDGTKFYESFKYKRGPDGEWFLKENSKLGSLTKVVAPEYFEDVSVPDLAADDLEGFEMRCRIKPKKNPNTGQVLGSTVDWETMRPLSKKRVTLAASGATASGATASGATASGATASGATASGATASGYVEGEDMPDPVEY